MRIFNETYEYSNLISRAGKSLMMTTAMTAVGLISMSSNANAQAASGPWDLSVDEGNFTKDFSTANRNIITQLTDRAIGSGDANIDLNETVVIRQNNSGSLFVARDNKADPTHILGSLRSNGRVMVIDQNGVFFGVDSVVDVGSIIATTGSISNADIMDGNTTFEFTNGPNGIVENKGTITVAEGGLAAFVAPTVKNSGVINAVMGTVAMASGQTVTLDMYGDGLVAVAVDGELADGLLKHTGSINANGGNVIVTAAIAKNAVDNVINMNGIVDVSSATVKGGKIILSGGSKGTVQVKKKLKVSGSGQDAGSIDITGENIKLTGSSKLRANSDSANAGDIIVRAEDTLTINGTISAQGLVGKGFVETSAPNTVFGSGASILATREWLLDPTNILIDAAMASLLSAQLDIGDMTVQTNTGGASAGNIELQNGVSIVKTSGVDTTFTMNAHNDITILGTIIGTGSSALNVDLNADFDVSGGADADVFVRNDINTSGGTFTVTASDDIDIKSGATVNTAGGDVSITSRGRGAESWLWMPSGGNAGSIITAGGDVSVAVSNVNLANGSSINAGTGNVTIGRDVDGTIGLGTASGDMGLTQAELNRIAAATLNIGNPVEANSHTTDINVTDVDLSSIGTVNLNALAASSVNYSGTNNFDALNTITDEINVLDGAVNATTSINFDAPTVNLNGDLDAPVITGTANIVAVQSDAAQIQDGVDVAAANATVNVVAGTFTESVNVNKNGLQLLGANAGTHGSDAGRVPETIVMPNSPGFYVTSNDVTIDGFTVDGSGASGNNGIETSGVNNFTAVNNILTGNTATGPERAASGYKVGIGVLVNNSTGDIKVTDNLIKDNTDGVRVLDSDAVVLGDIIVRDNIVRDNGDKGIIINRSDNVQVSKNTITGSGTGIWLEASLNGLTNNNDINDSSQNGIRLRNGSHGNELRNNRINDTGDNGILIVGSNSAKVLNNKIGLVGGLNNIGDNGIDLNNSAGAQIINNQINNTNDDAIDLDGSENSLIENNKIGLLGGVDNIGDDGIDVDDSANAILRDNKVRNTVENGVDLGGSAGAQILTNIINDTGDDGIDLDGSENALIQGNKVGLLGGVDNIGDDGIDLDNSAGAIINDNKIQNTLENGIDIRGSDNTDITFNVIREAGGDGVYVNPSDNVRILDNTITDVDGDGIRVDEGYDIRVRRNTIRRTGDDGIDITKNDFVRVTENTVVDTKKRGISIERAKDELANYAVVVKENTVKDTGRTSIVVDRFTTAKIVDNTVRDSDRAGIRVQRGDYARLRRNDVNGTKREGIKALGMDEVEIRRNQIRNARWDGILVDDFSYAWIGLNDVRITGDDGIHVSNGEVVAIYDNLIRKAGFFEDGKHADEAGADAIYVSNVGNDASPVRMASVASRLPLTEEGFNVEVIGNDVHKTYDDGIEVVDSGSTWVSENILTQIGFGIGEFGPEYYEGGDHYGADAVHLRNVKGLPYGLRAVTPPGELPYNRKTLNGTELREANLQEATPESVLFTVDPLFAYSSVVINNQIKRTADDGVEIIGSEDITTPVTLPATATPASTIEPTGRTVVAWNDIRHVGYGDIGGDGSGDGGDGLSYGSAPDGFGADAVHVRDIHSTVRRGDGDGGDGLGDGCGAPTAVSTHIGIGDDFAVEVLENYIWNTGDDGVEVRDSGRTRVANNEIYNVGLDTTDTPVPAVTTSMGYDRGANNGDGIHIENVYAGSGRDKKMAMGPGSFGNSVEILGNIIDHSGDDGVEVHYSGRTLVAENIINNSGVGLGHPYSGGDEGYGHDAIHVGGVYDDFDPYFGPTNSVVIRDNVIDTTGDDGVEVHYAGRTLIIDNEVSNVGYGGGVYYGYGDEDGADAINVMHVSSNDNNAPFSVDIRRNLIDVTADDGIEVAHSGRTLIRNNDLTNIGFDSVVSMATAMMPISFYGADGIHVRNVNSTSERPRQSDVRIINNRVTDTVDDGIEVIDTDRVTVKRNTVDQASDDGIVILRNGPFAMGIHQGITSSVRMRRVPSKAIISDNVVTNSGTPFPDETVVEFKSIRRAGGDGIEVGGFDKIIVESNDVSGSVENGLNVSGPNNGVVEVLGNTFIDNDTGALFQSGEIDLTGEGNIFNGGRVGMRFAPAEMFYLRGFATDAGPITPIFADMSLVNNTIGAQTFNGQSESFVELDNQAFFNPGTPTLLNALDSTYAATPFGRFTPSIDYAAGFPVDVVAYLESMFIHFNDNGTTGLFFFPLLPGIDQEDIFNYFGPYSAGLSGLNVTILGLPGIPGGTPVALNNIAPAAGGDTSPEALNDIETAAGGEESSCWSDALNTAGSGQSATVSYGGSAEDLLNGEANCGS